MNSGAGCIFLPIILFFGFFGILIIGFIVLIIHLIKKSKDSAWTGTLIDKMHKTRDVDDDGFHKVEHYYTLVVKTDEGKELKLGLSKEFYDRFNIGDKMKKDKGKLFPEKITS